MANQLTNILFGNQQQPMQSPNVPQKQQSQNPMAMVMQAMRNPAQFVMNSFPDIPPQYQGDPGQMLQYVIQSRGITETDINDLLNNIH